MLEHRSSGIPIDGVATATLQTNHHKDLRHKYLLQPKLQLINHLTELGTKVVLTCGRSFTSCALCRSDAVVGRVAMSLQTKHGSVQKSRISKPCSQARSVRVHDALSPSQLKVKLMMAASSDKLDLSDCELTEVPEEVFNLSNLRELSLAGNQLTTLPGSIAALSNLERFVIAGNRLRDLPEEITQLSELVGLWAHGNVLHTLPDDWSQLTKLQSLSLAGNALQNVPCSIVSLTALTELNLAGNKLAQLPPGLQGLCQLEKLIVHGNQLQSLPEEIGLVPALKVLHAMGNDLVSIPDTLTASACLEILNLADNKLTVLPDDWSAMRSLVSLLLYGNSIVELPLSLARLPSLRTAWLEGNPFKADAAAAFCDAVPSGSPLARIGLSAEQLPSNVAVGTKSAQGDGKVDGNGSTPGRQAVRLGTVAPGSGRGYFKLQRGPRSGRAHVEFADGTVGDRALLVAFGSAPGEPNWGGVVAKVRASCSDLAQREFDVLYVVDTRRSWYDGGDEGFDYWYQRLAGAVKSYKRVVMLGDSMGATAALMFSPLATAVLAFCPQVDLERSAIRPGSSSAWFAALRQRLMANVKASDADIQVFTGTWEHDLGQARLLPCEEVTLHVKQYDSHRLAYYLNAQEQLVPIIRRCLGEQMGNPAASARLANLL